MSTQPFCTPAKQLSHERFVNLFSTEICAEGRRSPWIFASRKASPGKIGPQPDAAIVVALLQHQGEACLVMTREFRAPLGTFELSLPSGLVDPGETAEAAALREFGEETGMRLTRVTHVSPPLASSAGLTDETISLVYGQAEGVPSRARQTEGEDIEIRLMRLDDVRRLLSSTTEDVISSRLYPLLLGYVMAGRISLP